MNTNNTKPVPARTQKLVFQEANSTCPFCCERGVATLEIHHIKSRAESGGNELENLILCCANCHSKITANVISLHKVHRVKFTLRHVVEQKHTTDLEKQRSRPSNILEFRAKTNNGIVANNIHLKTFAKSLKVQPATGIVAADGNERSYVKHLIDRYNDFKKADRNVTDFSYAVIYASIKNKFKCKWDYVPSHRFAELIEFLQSKIDGTILGKNRRRKGLKNYSTYDDYIDGYRLEIDG